jgi:tetratricopeptide (TPR) repeat protein
MAKRDRGRCLTDAGWVRLEKSIEAWEELNSCKCTQESLKNLSKLDIKTIANIRNRKVGSDVGSLQSLFLGLGLILVETDHHIPVPAKSEVKFDRNFVGRENTIDDLNKLVDKGAKIIVVQARGGVGKTTLARKYLQQEFDLFLEFPIAKETKDIASVESLIEEKLRQLGVEPGREFLVSIDRLKRKLQSERIGILIDNFEPALDSAGKLVDVHRRYVELLRILSDQSLKSVTLITSRERLREPSIAVQHYPLKGLDVKAWETYFCSRTISTDSEALLALHDAYDGNAKAMDILSGAIIEDYSGSVDSYWQRNQDDLLIERDLEDLVITQFDRLQDLDKNAYNLLCRMACYRYQDVPRVPIEGLLCLLWDVSEKRQSRVVKSLQDRSLVDFKDGMYWLHPVIREEAIERLRSCPDWVKTNEKAAIFWVDMVEVIASIDDALQAFEAYYHYISIEDFDGACDIILVRRENNWQSISGLGTCLPCTLASSFIRLGLVQQVISSCSYLLNKVDNQQSSHECTRFLGDAYRLVQVLGDAYWIIGNIWQALEQYEKSISMSSLNGDKQIEVASLFNLGLCKEALWEVDDAIEIYDSVILLAENTQYHRHAAQARYSLAYLYSCLDNSERARFYSEKAWEELSTVRVGVRSAGYRLYVLGFVFCYLENFSRSFEMYNKAIEYAEESKFIQLKAISLAGFSILYRTQKRIEESLLTHAEAIELLNHIGAKHSCAEAYYQLGLTYQTINENLRANENFQKAINVFSEIKAPKQVDKVKRSMILL